MTATEAFVEEVMRLVAANGPEIRLFQGHRETLVSGRFENATVAAPAGTVVVTTGQPLGRLAVYLLEPESDDGLTTWNVLDAALANGTAHPVLKTRR